VKIGLGKLALAGLGLAVMTFSIIGAGASASRDTTVRDEDGKHVHNMGLIAKQQADTILYGCLAIVGAVLLGAACIVDAIQAHGDRADKLAEKEAQDRDLMLRQLGAIVGNTTTAAAPVRAVAAKREAAFDEAIAAEMAQGKRAR